MFYYLLILFVVIPTVELTLLNLVHGSLGWLGTIAIVLGTGFLGASLAKSQGMRAWRRIHESLATGQTPGQELLEGALILFAGTVLLTPGLLTDTLGFVLRVPPVRRWFGPRLIRWFRKRTIAQFAGPPSPNGATAESAPVDKPIVIDAEFTNVRD